MIEKTSEILRIENGYYRSPEGYILNDLYLYASSGEIIGLTYRNPALAKIIPELLCGNLALDQGNISINDKPYFYPKAQDVIRQNSYLISQMDRLQPHLSFLDNYFLCTQAHTLFIGNKYASCEAVVQSGF